MQTVQADDFAAYHSLKLRRDANGVLVAEFDDSEPLIMTAQAHTEFVDSEIKAEGPAPCGLLQNSQARDRRDDHPGVPRSGNGYPTVQQIAATVATAVTAALCKDQSRQERGHFSLTQLDHASEPSRGYQSGDDLEDGHPIATSTPSTVQPNLHSAGNNGQAAEIKPQGDGYPTLQQIAETVATAVTTALCKDQSRKEREHFLLTQLDHPSEPSQDYHSGDDPVDGHTIGTSTPSGISRPAGLKFNPLSLPPQAVMTAENQSSIGVDSGEEGYLYLALQRALHSAAKIDAMPNPKFNAAPITVLPDNVGSLFSSLNGFAPPISTQPVATTESETSPSVPQSLIRYWVHNMGNICLGASLLIFLVVIVTTFR